MSPSTKPVSASRTRHLRQPHRQNLPPLNLLSPIEFFCICRLTPLAASPWVIFSLWPPRLARTLSVCAPTASTLVSWSPPRGRSSFCASFLNPIRVSRSTRPSPFSPVSAIRRPRPPQQPIRAVATPFSVYFVCYSLDFYITYVSLTF